MSFQKVYAQKDTAVNYKQYIEDKTDWLALKVFSLTKQNNFTFGRRGSDHSLIRYNINEASSIGIGFNYRWVGLGLSLGLPQSELNTQKKGVTRQLDIQLNSYGQKIGIDILFSRTRGYFINNPMAVYPNYISSNSYPQYPNLTTIAAGANVFYIVNHKKYSMRASFIQTQIQRKSAGSLLIVPSISYYFIKSDSSLVPFSLAQLYTVNEQLKTGEFYTASACIGYGHTFVLFKRAFFSLNFIAGPSLQFQNINVIDNQEYNKTVIAGRSAGRIAFGYNHDRFFIVLSVLGDNYRINITERASLRYTIGSARLSIGTRFRVDHHVKKSKFNFLFEKN